VIVPEVRVGIARGYPGDVQAALIIRAMIAAVCSAVKK